MERRRYMMRWIGTLAIFVAACEGRSELELEGPTKQMPTDIATITARFRMMQGKIRQLEAKALGVSKLIQTVESQGNQTLARVQLSEKALLGTSDKAAVNKYKVLGLANETDQAQLKVESVLGDMRNLIKIVADLDKSSMTMGSKAESVATQVADLEDNVKRLMPGESGITVRIAADQKMIETYQGQVGSGLPGMVEKSLRGHFRAATNRLQSLTEDIEKEKSE